MDITPERSSNGNQTHIASFRPELPVEVKGNDGHLTRNTVGNGNGSGPEPEEQVEQDDVQQYEVEPKAVDPHFGGRFGWTRLKGWSCIRELRSGWNWRHRAGGNRGHRVPPNEMPVRRRVRRSGLRAGLTKFRSRPGAQTINR